MNGPQPLGIGDVMAYCAMAAIADPSDRMLLLRLVQAMDGEYLRIATERQKKKKVHNGDTSRQN